MFLSLLLSLSLLQCVYSRIGNGGSLWLRSGAQEEKSKKSFVINKLRRFRGGASENIKGDCIGIDLGTTYR